LTHNSWRPLALAVGTALLIVACSGDDASEATPAAATQASVAEAAATQDVMTAAAWAGDVCGAIATWEDSIKSIASETRNGISGDTLSQKFSDAEQATQDLANELVAIGAPDTENGKKVKQDIEKLTSDMQTGVADLKGQVEALGGSGVEGIATGVDEIKGDIEGLVTDVKHAFHEIRQLEPANELSNAIKDDPTCETLRPNE
jgi:hypothetical protein